MFKFVILLLGFGVMAYAIKSVPVVGNFNAAPNDSQSHLHCEALQQSSEPDAPIAAHFPVIAPIELTLNDQIKPIRLAETAFQESNHLAQVEEQDSLRVPFTSEQWVSSYSKVFLQAVFDLSLDSISYEDIDRLIPNTEYERKFEIEGLLTTDREQALEALLHEASSVESGDKEKDAFLEALGNVSFSVLSAVTYVDTHFFYICGRPASYLSLMQILDSDSSGVIALSMKNNHSETNDYFVNNALCSKFSM
ncbi:hypothetical protein [Enterovibrio norvegicus]|uniref:hypothetical protein n=1 Tax=Enterovibrio norvegicus TaxID=188144 RepID=UPI00352DFA70